MNTRRSAVLLSLVFLLATGCAVSKASKLPPKKDFSFLKEGTPREYVVAELGQPKWTGEREGMKKDMYVFKQGVSKNVKFFRVLGHAVMDVLTLGIWEVFGTPIESVAAGKQMKIEITYDEEDKLKFYNTVS